MNEIDDGKKKWELIDEINTGKNVDDAKPLSQQKLSETMSLSKNELSSQTVLNRFREKMITQKTALVLLKEHHMAKIDVAKYQLEQAVRVKKREVFVDAEHFLAEINRQHIKDLTDLGLTNTKDHMIALEKLITQTSEIMDRLQTGDFPESMKKDTIKNVLQLHERFIDRLMNQAI